MSVSCDDCPVPKEPAEHYCTVCGVDLCDDHYHNTAHEEHEAQLTPRVKRVLKKTAKKKKK